MSYPPPILRDQRKIDSEHLKLLAVFHFVCAGLALLGILFIVLHYMMFQAVFSNPKMWQDQKVDPPPVKEIFAVLKWFYLAFGAWCLVSGILNVMSAIRIRARKSRTFSMIVAGVNCLHIPLGTALGIFTIIILNRETVRELYDSWDQGGGPKA
ncbi:MAG TPA: hypothetical protein VGO11_17620 [Chthoniobacteraceae bacterium]|nr:hypothetical protein [Chthoniobacteraceae bacterium]